MNDTNNLNPPAILLAIENATKTVGFPMGSDRLTGALLRMLAASKPSSILLELGTGTGLATAWLLDGMDNQSTLLTVDNDAEMQTIARQHLGDDPRLTLRTMDGGALIEEQLAAGIRFDLVFADTWPGKYYYLDETLHLLKPGGLYVIDDLFPQPNWPTGHAPKVAALIAMLENRADLRLAKLGWATGLIVAARVH
jgi:predicted O-methyltransferase YrrM